MRFRFGVDRAVREALRLNAMPSVTFDGSDLRHLLPETRSTDHQHVLDETCWCGPITRTVFGASALEHRSTT